MKKPNKPTSKNVFVDVMAIEKEANEKLQKAMKVEKVTKKDIADKALDAFGIENDDVADINSGKISEMIDRQKKLEEDVKTLIKTSKSLLDSVTVVSATLNELAVDVDSVARDVKKVSLIVKNLKTS